MSYVGMSLVPCMNLLNFVARTHTDTRAHACIYTHVHTQEICPVSLCPAHLIGRHRATTATHCKTLQHTATHCNTLQNTATHTSAHTYMTQPSFFAFRASDWATQSHNCNTLQHTTTHCNTQLCTHIYEPAQLLCVPHI